MLDDLIGIDLDTEPTAVEVSDLHAANLLMAEPLMSALLACGISAEDAGRCVLKGLRKMLPEYGPVFDEALATLRPPDVKYDAQQEALAYVHSLSMGGGASTD